jgi:NADH:ubiquinone oxidoreductase subunit F (NADH-binding)
MNKARRLLVPEKRVVLQNCGVIDPRDIDSYINRDGFKALKKALKMPPDKVIGEIKASGLRGRGGAGFPCGLKWELARKSPGDEKYVICNADEGEVGTFKDRYILESDPFSLIEGIAIAGYAIGAKKAYIYLRAEYHFLLDLLEGAIAQSKKKGFLRHLDIEIRQGAGAYVCGEESALMDSIEGKRGEVRYRPPFPPTSGLWGKPTIINNVETLMNIPRIVLNGAEWFNKMGTERSKGTKVFSVSGDVKNPGVYELVLGSSLKELVEDLAGAKRVQAVQVGGATGRIIPADQLDTPLSFETILGAGAVTVFDKSRDIVDIVYRTLEFLAEESCGKCAPCREGTEAMVEILGRFSKGEGREKDITVLGELADTMMLAAMCGLGQAAPIPVMDSLQYFRGAYDQRISQS